MNDQANALNTGFVIAGFPKKHITR